MDASDSARDPQGGRDLSIDPILTRELLSHLPGLAYRCRLDRDWTMEFISRGSRALTGFDPEDLVGNRVASYASLIHPSDREHVWRAVRDAVAAGRPFTITYRIRRADGGERWVWEQGSALLGPDGEPEALQGFVTDITHRKELAERADRAYRLFHALTEQSFTGVFVLRGGRIDYANPRFLDLVGLTGEELDDGVSFGSLVRESDGPTVDEAIAELLAGDVDVARLELTIARSGGTERELQAQLNPVLFDGEHVVLGVVLDITERRRAERRYHEAQKMESLGALARGIAHDFNNILAVVKSSAHLLAEVATLDDDSLDDVERILEAVGRGSALSRQLMDFGHVEAPRVRDVHVARVIGDMVPMLDRLTGSEVALAATVADDLPLLGMDRSHLEQVVMNLVVNGRDAMPDGGEIRIDARTETEGPPSAPPHRRARPHVVITVQDDGTGIEPEFLPHLFEPYFTTKGDKGTGLGLGNVWRIATELGGTVEVDSEVGRGSTFRVYLPADHD